LKIVNKQQTINAIDGSRFFDMNKGWFCWFSWKQSLAVRRI